MKRLSVTATTPTPSLQTKSPATPDELPVFVLTVQFCTDTLSVTLLIEMPVPPAPLELPAAVQLVTVALNPEVISNPMPLELAGERNRQPFTKIVLLPPAISKPPMLVLPQLRRKVIPCTVILGEAVALMLKELPVPPLSRVICVLLTPGSARMVSSLTLELL